MSILKKAHLGEVSVTVWPEVLKEMCRGKEHPRAGVGVGETAHAVRGTSRYTEAPAGVTLLAGALLFLASVLAAGCAGSGAADSRITVAQFESLNDLEALLPLTPDSIVTRYRNYDSLAFRNIYSDKLTYVTDLIDSLNGSIPDSLRIDTLAIDHSFGTFGEAARSGRSIVISASYFIVFDDWSVLRSVVFHEFGHIAYDLLGSSDRRTVDTVWRALESGALLYLFHDGEYSGNARFGGHPDESPSELFASAYNLIHNRAAEMRARLTYVEPRHFPLIRMLSILTGNSESAVVASEP